MSTRRRARVPLTVVMIGAAGLGLLAQDVSLGYRWNKGETLRYRMTTQSDVVMSGMPGVGDMTINTTIAQITQLTPTDVAADGGATLQMKIDSVRMDIGGPMGTMSYDSAAPAASPDPVMAEVGKMFSAMIGEPITVVMAANGTVQKVEGMTKIASKMLKQAGAQNPMGMGGLDAFMSDEAMTGTFAQSFGQFPAKPVKSGDSWQSQVKAPNPFGVMVMDFTHTLKGIEKTDGRDLARIATTAKISSASTGATPPMPIPMKIEMGNGTAEGEMWFDVKNGRIHRGSAVSNMPMSMSMTGPDGATINIQAATKSTVKMELIEK